MKTRNAILLVLILTLPLAVRSEVFDDVYKKASVAADQMKQNRAASQAEEPAFGIPKAFDLYERKDFPAVISYALSAAQRGDFHAMMFLDHVLFFGNAGWEIDRGLPGYPEDAPRNWDARALNHPDLVAATKQAVSGIEKLEKTPNKTNSLPAFNAAMTCRGHSSLNVTPKTEAGIAFVELQKADELMRLDQNILIDQRGYYQRDHGYLRKKDQGLTLNRMDPPGNGFHFFWKYYLEYLHAGKKLELTVKSITEKGLDVQVLRAMVSRFNEIEPWAVRESASLQDWAAATGRQPFFIDNFEIQQNNGKAYCCSSVSNLGDPFGPDCPPRP